MALLSATQASKAVGKSVPTVTRAIKSGKLSAEKRDGGGYDIDPSELFRVWPAVSNVSDATPNVLERETPNETSVLKREVDLLREMLDETKADRDEWKEQAKRVTLLVEDHNAKPKGFWARLRG
jgi:hypothetical protein